MTGDGAPIAVDGTGRDLVNGAQSAPTHIELRVSTEFVSEGSHATYLFRVVPRAAYNGEPPAGLGASGDQADDDRETQETS